jgi:hypothetical protein
MSKFDQQMQEIFKVSSESSEEKEINPIVPSNNTYSSSISPAELDQDLTDAYNQTRENLQDIIDQGKEALEEILNVAKESQHPRAYEVYGSVFKNLVDANKELLIIQKQMRDMDKSNKKDSSGTNIDKAIFVGSTAELSKFIKNNID